MSLATARIELVSLDGAIRRARARGDALVVNLLEIQRTELLVAIRRAENA